MFGKIRTIAGTSLYITYTDVGALVMMLLAPVLLSTIIGFAFGEGDNAIDLGTSELLIINLDETQAVDSAPDEPPQALNYGTQVYQSVLIDNIPAELAELMDATIADDIDASKQQVDDGDYDAVLIIPADFTANVLNPEAQGTVELYYNPFNEVASSILQAVVNQLTAQLNTGQAAQNVLVGDENPFLINAGVARGQSPEAISNAASEVLSSIFVEGTDGLVSLEAVDVEGEQQIFDSLQYFAPSMAILFLTFAMAAGMRSILEETRTWTLQRLMTTPTPRWAYMVGKMLGTFASGIVQMMLLILITSLVAAALGRSVSIWGDNYLGIVLAIVVVVAAASSLGLLLTSFARTERQADNISGAVLIVMAVLGGGFIPVDGNAILAMISNFSLHHWGIEAFTTLSDNGSLSDILPSLGALLVMTVVFFGIALWNFNQRKDM